MATNYRELRALLAKNIAALLDANPEHGNPRRLADKYDLGEGTVRRLLKADEGPQPQLDTIAKLAKAFEVPPWMLLHPHFDAQTRSVAGELSAEVLAAVRKLVSLFDRQPAGAAIVRQPEAAYEFSDQAREIARDFDELQELAQSHLRLQMKFLRDAQNNVNAAGTQRYETSRVRQGTGTERLGREEKEKRDQRKK